MTFKKGEVSNPNGRPVGAKGKATLAKERLIEILNRRMSEIEEMDVKDFYKGVVSLLPKETKIELKAEATRLIVELDKKTVSDTQR